MSAVTMVKPKLLMALHSSSSKSSCEAMGDFRGDCEHQLNVVQVRRETMHPHFVRAQNGVYAPRDDAYVAN